MSWFSSCSLPPLLARIRSSAQSQPTACTARPGPTPSQGSNKVQSLTRLPTLDGRLVVLSSCRPRPSPTTGDCASSALLTWIPSSHSGQPLRHPLQCSLTSSLGDSSNRRHRTRASVRSTKTCTCPRAATFPFRADQHSPLLLCLVLSSSATVLCSLLTHYCSSGMHLCRPCGINIGPLGPLLGYQLKGPIGFLA